MAGGKATPGRRKETSSEKSQGLKEESGQAKSSSSSSSSRGGDKGGISGWTHGAAFVLGAAMALALLSQPDFLSLMKLDKKSWRPAADADIISPQPSAVLQRWDPVAVNHTRKLALDDSGRVYLMRTVALDPPVFEIPDFLNDDECARIIALANKTGLFTSDYTYLDGSNLGQKKDMSNGLPEEEANKLFRYSDQTWLEHDRDPLLQGMMARVMKLGLLPPSVRGLSEQLQVVHYKSHGHYECHYDSENSGQGPCCADPIARKRGMQTGVEALKRPLEERCRLCRFMTVLYYLVDTEEGGGTVFPLADTTDEQYEQWRHFPHDEKYRQTRKCAPGLTVAPKKGKAVLWYNHHVDRGYLGPLDKRSLHGGCNVIHGEKWIANHWMTFLPHPDDPRAPASSHYDASV